ncbi:MAG: ribbon-helix-helix protein, CopG family [Spirochaetales bacterium]|nr:MAG: ribbon-helix-helix protein, CopG family [Spirochaetales bacterium]
MAKTITIRIDDDTYEILRRAADGERRSISNFIEYATLSYVTREVHVSNEEMSEILSDASLVKGLKRGLDDVKKGRYAVVG